MTMVWDVASRTAALRLPGQGVGPTVRFSGFTFGTLGSMATSAAFSPDGKTLVTGDASATATVRDSRTGKVRRRLRLTQQDRRSFAHSITSLSITPDGKTLAVGHRYRVPAMDVIRGSNGRERLDAYTHGDAVLFDLARGTRKPPLAKRTEGAFVAFAPRGKVLATTLGSTMVYLWDWEKRMGLRPLTQDGDGRVNALAFSPNGRILACARFDNCVVLWDVARGALLRRLIGPTKSVTSVAFSPSGEVIAGGSEDGKVTLWSLQTGRMLHTLPHNQPVHAVAFSPEGSLLASGGEDGTVKLWPVKSLSRP
jgi:WD40 repeat protein